MAPSLSWGVCCVGGGRRRRRRRPGGPDWPPPMGGQHSVVAFVELDSEEEARRAARALEGFPWSVYGVLQVKEGRKAGKPAEGAQHQLS